ncbi:hypothetical protein ACVWYH_001867 [Bradyrhizobium sp. GM24.11]
MHVNAWRAIGSVPKAIGWDALRSGVTAICRYELAVNRTYQELAKITTRLSYGRRGPAKGDRPTGGQPAFTESTRSPRPFVKATSTA